MRAGGDMSYCDCGGFMKSAFYSFKPKKHAIPTLKINGMDIALSRHLEVKILLNEGKSNKEIAEILGLSLSQVGHIKNGHSKSDT